MELEDLKSVEDNQRLIFRTKKSREIYLKILNRIKKYFVIDETTALLDFLKPTIEKKKVLERQEWISRSIKELQDRETIENIEELLKKASKIDIDSKKRHNNIVIAFGDENSYNKYKKILGEQFFTVLISNEQDIFSISHYEEIRYVKSEQDDLLHLIEELEQSNIYSSNFDLEELAPEIYTDYLELNKEPLKAIKKLRKMLQIKVQLPESEESEEYFDLLEVESEKIRKELESIIQKNIIKEQFSGLEIIEVIREESSILKKLSKDSQEEIIKTKNYLLKRLEEHYGVGMNDLLNISPTGKVIVNEEGLSKAINSFRANKQLRKTKQKQELASQAKILKEKHFYLKDKILELDLKIALKKFYDEFDLENPLIESEGLEFVFGRNISLSNPVPIEYYLGKEEKVAVVTGANSGGKTTLLELVLQIQIMTQMGLGVPAKKSRVSLVKEIYYFSKNKGSLNAGAFETLLKQFSSISDDDNKKLILADEIESVTEPDIATKIIKGIIEYSQKNPNNILMIVTHMGKELKKLGVKARFDGIEAKGLDEKLNLIVERNPIIGRIARSTPQLIIERLAKKEQTAFYNYLHDMVKIET